MLENSITEALKELQEFMDKFKDIMISLIKTVKGINDKYTSALSNIGIAIKDAIDKNNTEIVRQMESYR